MINNKSLPLTVAIKRLIKEERDGRPPGAVSVVTDQP